MDQPVHVSLRINILNIDKIDTVNMMFALTMEVNVEWRDHRLKYKNLREGLGQNQLSSEVNKVKFRPFCTLLSWGFKSLEENLGSKRVSALNLI